MRLPPNSNLILQGGEEESQQNEVSLYKKLPNI